MADGKEMEFQKLQGMGDTLHKLIREKGYQVSRDSNCEFADVHSIFPKYARSNFWKLWLDYLHLNDSGADMYCDHIFFNLMQ